MTTTLEFVPQTEFTRTLSDIDSPYDRCRLFAALTRINTLYMIMRAGSGHLGSSFSACDIVTWLLLEELREPFAPHGDVYFSSKGHDVPIWYAALIGLGELDEGLLEKLRRIGGLPGHPDVHTPHVHANTGSLGMGISKAKGMVLADRLAGRRRRIFVLTGDGELQEGQNWEALAGARDHVMGELTVIVDHNKIQSDTWVRDVSDLGDLEARFRGCGWEVLRCDGHDLAMLAATLRTREMEYPDQPVLVIADTVKGGGCATFAATSMSADEWRYRFHSGAPSRQDYESAHQELLVTANGILSQYGLPVLRMITAAVPTQSAPSGGERLVTVYGEALVAHANSDERIVALDADLVVDTGLVPFWRSYPERFFECGIAEQDMVSMAGGMAANGYLPFVHTFSCFLHSRANEQIYNNATEGRKCVYVGSLAGLVPAAPGHSHQAVRDVSAVGAIPDLVVVEPSNAAEVHAVLEFCRDTPHSVYLRLTNLPVPAPVSEVPATVLTVGKGRVIRRGSGVAAIGAGPIVLGSLLTAAEQLSQQGVDLTVVNLPWLNRVDPNWLAGIVDGLELLLVVENHYVRGGQADLVARTLLEQGDPLPRFRGYGLTEVPACGTPTEALAAHGLDAQQLVQRIEDEIAGKGLYEPLEIRLATNPRGK